MNIINKRKILWILKKISQATVALAFKKKDINYFSFG